MGRARRIKKDKKDKKSVDVCRTALYKFREIRDEAKKKGDVLQKWLQYLVGSLSMNNEGGSRGLPLGLHQRFILW